MHTDIGAGTGILSLFAKSAGASKIYAVEASPMAVHLKKVILKNEAEDVIKVLHQMVEDVELTERVDIIIRYLLTNPSRGIRMISFFDSNEIRLKKIDNPTLIIENL